MAALHTDIRALRAAGWLRMTWRGYWTDEVGPVADVASLVTP